MFNVVLLHDYLFQVSEIAKSSGRFGASKTVFKPCILWDAEGIGEFSVLIFMLRRRYLKLIVLKRMYGVVDVRYRGDLSCCLLVYQVSR